MSIRTGIFVYGFLEIVQLTVIIILAQTNILKNSRILPLMYSLIIPMNIMYALFCIVDNSFTRELYFILCYFRIITQMFVLPIFILQYNNRILGEYFCSKLLGRLVDVNEDLFGDPISLIMMLASNSTSSSTNADVSESEDPAKVQLEDTLCLTGTVIATFIIFVIY